MHFLVPLGHAGDTGDLHTQRDRTVGSEEGKCDSSHFRGGRGSGAHCKAKPPCAQALGAETEQGLGMQSGRHTLPRHLPQRLTGS